MELDRTDLEAVLKAAIRDSGMTQSAIAKATALDVGQLSRLMAGKRTLTLPAASKLTRFFGLELKPARRGRGKG